MDTNTDTYGMIKRVRHLQKAIINKSAEVQMLGFFAFHGFE